jgi:deoxyribodipyrimidine photo-lyase
MKQILWFRRDLRVNDSAILSNAKDEVLPIFIFDKNILDLVDKNDRRVTFIYESVIKLKENLKVLGLDLAIFYSTPKEVFESFKNQGFDSILCSVDFDKYAKKRDEEISKIIPMQTFTDSFLTHPNVCLN